MLLIVLNAFVLMVIWNPAVISSQLMARLGRDDGNGNDDARKQ